MTDYRLYWIWLAQGVGQGSKLAVKLINIFGNAAGVYSASFDDLEQEGGGLTAREIAAARRILSDKSLTEAEEILERASCATMRVLVPTDPDFPRSLINLRDAPMVLYVLGRLPNAKRELSVSVVGTRKMSESGRRNAFAFGYGLASGGATVVSGMALGADSMALCGAITAGGSTVAVLGGGADVVYPRDHENLYNTILSSGAIVSEYPPGTPPKGHHFPVRNRIISGLSSATVVIEADMNSGALITARHALYQGRSLFSVPGDVLSHGSDGTNGLIKDGAVLATDAEDVLREFEFIFPQSVNLRSFSRAMKRIDIDAESADAMARMRISARGRGNYYGKGTYGGKRTKSYNEKISKESEKQGRRSAENRITMGGGGNTSNNIGTSTMQTDQAPVHAPHIDVDFLDGTSVRVYNMMKPDVPMTADELVTKEIPISDVLSSLTMLEIAGAVEAGAGGYFLRRSSDDIELNFEEK